MQGQPEERGRVRDGERARPVYLDVSDYPLPSAISHHMTGLGHRRVPEERLTESWADH